MSELRETLINITEEKNAKIIPSNIKEGVQIFDVVGEYKGLNTSDATATAEDMASGKTAYVKGEKITGNVQTIRKNYTSVSQVHSIVPKDVSSEIEILSKYNNNMLFQNGSFVTTKPTYQELAEAINLTPDKIVKGETVLAIEGSYEGLDTSDATAGVNDILANKTAYVKGEKIEGTIQTSPSSVMEQSYTVQTISSPSNVFIDNIVLMPSSDGKYIFVYDWNSGTSKFYALDAMTLELIGEKENGYSAKDGQCFLVTYDNKYTIYVRGGMSCAYSFTDGVWTDDQTSGGGTINYDISVGTAGFDRLFMSAGYDSDAPSTLQYYVTDMSGSLWGNAFLQGEIQNCDTSTVRLWKTLDNYYFIIEGIIDGIFTTLLFDINKDYEIIRHQNRRYNLYGNQYINLTDYKIYNIKDEIIADVSWLQDITLVKSHLEFLNNDTFILELEEGCFIYNVLGEQLESIHCQCFSAQSLYSSDGKIWDYYTSQGNQCNKITFRMGGELDSVERLGTNYVDTQFGTALANDIAIGKIAYVDGNKIIGTSRSGDYNSKMATSTNRTSLNITNHIVLLPEFNLTGINTLSNAFKNLYNLVALPNLETNHITSFYYAFANCYSLTSLPNYNMSNVTSISGICLNCNKVREIPNWDIPNLKSMESAFSGCKSITTIPNFNTTNVTSMHSTFRSCTSLTSIPLLDFSNVKGMQNCFDGCTALTSLPLLNTINVNNFNYAFYSMRSMTEFPAIDTSNGITFYEMFRYCYNVHTIPALAMDRANSISGIFTFCNNLVNFGGFINYGKACNNSRANVYRFDLNYTNLSHDSLVNIIDNLYDLHLSYDTANGGTMVEQHCNLGSKLMNRLSAEEIQRAADKGWIFY